jgi:hypothetical protein
MSKVMLNLIETIIANNESYKKMFTYMRIDGDTEISERE